ncbi:GNAT family N-acetyltransferase [Blastococcus sp. TF02A-30]|uniref:GNAT family N-acetyltransferase n=1 Tax=Blastococcus sp. TF02A-30 TaxID=2250580 RepID=UPI001313F178|nr:GNAT family N-acetyltransferase [Blastococcus sp. TF02A-30]
MDIELTLRPVAPDDAGRFCRLWDRLSPETVYRRFHAPIRRPGPAAVRHLVDVDHDLREALVAVVGDDVVGVARYDRSPGDPARAEVAVVVEDGWQGAGVGRQLLRALAERAAARGVTTVTADVQPDNAPALALAARLLPGTTTTDDAGVVTVTSPLAAVPAPA